MGFDLYFAGSRNKELDDWLASHNCNRLFSQYNDRKAIEQWHELGSCGKLLIDSGAFTAHTRDVAIDVDEYIDYINSNADRATLFVQVDCIPGKFGKPKTIQEKLEAPKKSWDNYLYMRERVTCPDKLVPVYHQGEDSKWLINMLEAKFEGKHIPYIGISPANDVSVNQKVMFIDTAFKIIKKSSNSNVKTHAFGMTSLPVLEKFPFTSADSTSWLMTAAMGNVMTPYGQINCSDRTMDKNHINAITFDAKTVLCEYFSSCGYTLEQVISDYTARMILNCIYLKAWSDSYVYKPYTKSKKQLI